MQLGERSIFPVALGGARWSLATPPSVELGRATLQAALRAGVELIDTAPAYAPPGEPHHNERLIADVIGDSLRSEEMILSTKVGHGRLGDGSFWIDGHPSALREQCEKSLIALNLDSIPLLSLHWPDPEVPLAESVAALEELREEGKIRHIGICNVDRQQLAEAMTAARISVVQNRFSALDPDTEMLEVCRDADVSLLGYSPFGGSEASLLENNPFLSAVARRHGVSPYRVAIRLLLDLDGVTPIVGAGKPSSIEDAAMGVELNLTDEDRRILARVDPT